MTTEEARSSKPKWTFNRIRAAVFIIAFTGLILIVFWYSREKALPLIGILLVPFIVSILRLRSGSSTREIIQGLLVAQTRSKRILVICILWVLTIVMTWSLWLFIGSAR
jgi:hypothetical protein